MIRFIIRETLAAAALIGFFLVCGILAEILSRHPV